MMFDVNISYGNWPFQDFRDLTPELLVARLRRDGITGGLISSIDAVFQEDLAARNAELFDAFRFAAPDFIPVLTVNPLLADMMEMVAEFSPRAVRLLPNYHDYSLLSTDLEPLATWCSDNHVPLLIPRRLIDERSHHPSCKVPSTPIDEIAEFALSRPDLKVVCLNLYFHEFDKLGDALSAMHVDIACAETLNTLESLLDIVEPERIMMGSNTPFHYAKSAVMKITTAKIPLGVKKAVACDNAFRLIVKP